MTNALSIALLLIQILAFIWVAFLAPWRLQMRWWTFPVYTICSALLWILITIASMLLDSRMQIDVPGIGYLVLGAISWTIGAATMLLRGFDGTDPTN